MTLDEFKCTFFRICSNHHIDPQECVVKQLSSAHKAGGSAAGGYCLNLSTQSLTVQTCVVLAKVLATDRTFTDIRFDDCLLTEEGLKVLMHGLTTNVRCRKLSLKGNNARGIACEAMGKMLRQNKNILSLTLEWNAMGMLGTSFGVFCEGLSSNATLQMLDLRNNQIAHEGAGELAAALRHNSSLRGLDLRWNNIGLIGSRMLLKMLDTNRTLVKLEMAGNNIPNEVLRSIELAVGHNAERTNLVTDYTTRSSMMSQQIQTLKKSKQTDMLDMLSKLDKQDAASTKSQRSSQVRISQLQDTLEERRDQFNSLASKLSLAESEIAMSESKLTEMGALLEIAKEEQTECGKTHHHELKREREDKALIEAKLNKELIEVNEKGMQLDNKVDGLDRRCRAQQEQLYELKQQLAHAQADQKVKATHYEERIQLEKQKTKDAYRDAEQLKEKDAERLRREADESERVLRERLNKLELSRLETDEELSRQRSAAAADKLQAEETLRLTKQRVKNDEEQRSRQLQEKLRVLQISKDELENHYTQQGCSISELQAKNGQMTLENESLRLKIDDLNQDLAGKNGEMMTEVGRVKIDLNQKIQRLEAERQTHAELYAKVERKEAELADMSSRHRGVLEERDRELTRVTERLRMREAEMQTLRSDELQRASLLQTAVQCYLSKAPSAGGS